MGWGLQVQGRDEGEGKERKRERGEKAGGGVRREDEMGENLFL